jgi:hypothetical protein
MLPSLLKLFPALAASRLQSKDQSFTLSFRFCDLCCPCISLLPGVLWALIYTFEAPATTEELWATGLG